MCLKNAEKSLLKETKTSKGFSRLKSLKCSQINSIKPQLEMMLESRSQVVVLHHESRSITADTQKRACSTAFIWNLDWYGSQATDIVLRCRRNITSKANFSRNLRQSSTTAKAVPNSRIYVWEEVAFNLLPWYYRFGGAGFQASFYS